MQTDIDKVVRALEHPKYDWRTIPGMVAETRLSPERVAEILAELGNRIVKTSAKDGSSLYTTRKHYNRTTTPVRQFFTSLSGELK